MKPALVRATNIPLAQELIVAAEAGDLASVKLLAGNGAEPAITNGDIPQEVVSKISNDHSIGFSAIFHLHGSKGVLNAALYVAAIRGHHEIVDFFIGRGDYCPNTLGVALYAARDEKTVEKLLAAGADPWFENGKILDRAIASGRIGISDMLIKKSGDYSQALASCLYYLQFYRAVQMLDYGVDVRPGIEAIANKVTDRTLLVTPYQRAELLDYYDTLMAYAEARGDNMHELVEHTVRISCYHWSSPLIDRLLNSAHFKTHPDRAALLERVAERTALSSNPGYDTDYTEKEYEALAKKLLKEGASSQAMLHNGITAGCYAVCNAAFSALADPRRGRPSAVAKIDSRIKNQVSDPGLLAMSKLIHEIADLRDDIDRVFLNVYCPGEMTVGFLHTVEPDLNKNGLMFAAAAGKIDDAVKVLVDAGEKITASDLASYAGDTLAAILSDRGQAGVLCDARLFADTRSYLLYWQSLSEDVQAQEQERHADVLQQLAGTAVRDVLAQKRIHAGNRWKL